MFRYLMAVVIMVTGCSHLPSRGKTESERLNEFLDQTFEEYLDLSPESLTSLGQKKHYDKLDDRSEEFGVRMNTLDERKLVELKQFNESELDPQAKVSYTLFKMNLENSIADFRWRDYGYVVNQLYGIHSELPVFMINFHAVDNESDLRAYIARLEEFKRVLQQVNDQILRSEKKGIVPPRFVFPYVLEGARNVIQGQPFDEKSKEDSPLYADFKKKVVALKLDAVTQDYFLKRGQKALLDFVKPGYQQLIKTLTAQQKTAKTDAGVWKFPDGQAYYNTRVARYTTTNMTPDQIHKLGVDNVARLHGEMNTILKKINYKGTLQSFFKELRDNNKYYFSNTEEGRQGYLALARGFYKDIQKEIPKFFRLLPKAPFEIRAVEKFRENSAGVAFYDHPSEDGKRPGVYYVNLKDMKNLPKHETEVVLYHEGAPGHHFQIAIAQELQGIPKFRRYAGYTAYSEGWGLYTERLAQEMGGYKDLYSEFGKLSLELLRASRLVVDTGMHSKKWTREKAIKYLNDNLPGALDDQKNEIERYIVLPGQATAYMVGMLKIYELREKAKTELGPKFDIRDFHDVVLGSGALPLLELENQVNTYIAAKKK